MTESGEFAMWLAVGVGQVAFWAAMYPLIRAWARRIEGRAIPKALLARVEALETRGQATGEADLVAQHVLELEERLDFAERLLARGDPVHERRPVTPVGGSS